MTLKMQPTSSPDHSLDARGLICPEPLMVVRAEIRKIASGTTLHVIATDPSTARDIPSYCKFVEHQLLEHWEDDGEFHYVLQKG